MTVLAAIKLFALVANSISFFLIHFLFRQSTTYRVSLSVENSRVLGEYFLKNLLD